MGEDWTCLLQEIEQDVVQCHAVWQTYREMFAVDEATIEMLNQIAPFCVRVIQDSLVDEVILGVSRLCDRPTICGKQTLVLESLIAQLPAHLAHLTATLTDKLAVVRHKSDELREHRHRRIAHTNLDYAMGRDALPGFSRAMIEEALLAIRDFMGPLHPEMRYEKPFVLGSGMDLIAALGRARWVSELQDKAWAGEVTPDQLFDEIRRRQS